MPALLTASLEVEQGANVSACREQTGPDMLEGNGLYDIMGWAASKVFQKVDCDVCRAAFIAHVPINECYTHYTAARSNGGLTHPSQELLAAAKLAEPIIVSNTVTVHQTADVDLRATKQILEALSSCGFDFPTCHNVLYLVFKRYVRLRINQYASTITSNNTAMKKRQYGSKTACRTMLIP